MYVLELTCPDRPQSATARTAAAGIVSKRRGLAETIKRKRDLGVTADRENGRTQQVHMFTLSLRLVFFFQPKVFLSTSRCTPINYMAKLITLVNLCDFIFYFFCINDEERRGFNCWFANTRSHRCHLKEICNQRQRDGREAVSTASG